MNLKKNYNLEFLLNRFLEGDQKAFKMLFDCYWEIMFVKANTTLHDRDIAQDIVQEIWINLWHQREKLKITDFEAYIIRSVSNGCYKYLRDNKINLQQLQVIDSLSLTAPEVENQHNLLAMQDVIDESLHELSPRCQQIFRLSRFEDSTNEEIAQRLGISKRSVENQVSIALKAIRRHMASFYIFSMLYFYS